MADKYFLFIADAEAEIQLPVQTLLLQFLTASFKQVPLGAEFFQALVSLLLTPALFFFFPKEKFPQLLFHPFTDKNAPRALIKHFCAPSSKPTLFTLNLAPNKGKWVSHFEAEQWVSFSLCFVSGTLSSGDLRIQSTAYGDKKHTKRTSMPS